MDYGITEQGFVLKRFDTILSELQSAVSEELGFDVSQNPQSMLNAAILYPIADQNARLWEVAQNEYYAKYPATANGINLDNACQYGSVLREPNKKSSYIIHCTGIDGTVIPTGSQIGSNTNPQKVLECKTSTQISIGAANALVIKVAAMDGNSYSVTIDGQAYTFSGGATADAVLAGLMSVLPSNLIMSEGDELLSVALPTDSATSTFALSNNLTTQTVTSLVYFDTVDYGAIELPNGTITEMITNVPGLSSVVNKLTPTLGRLEQDDVELRQDYIKKSYATASKTAEAVQSYLLTNVDGIQSCTVYENYTDTTDADGRPPHSIEAVVDGGQDNDIATAILESRAGGIRPYGSTTVSVVTDRGDTIDVGFSRPENIYVWLRVRITVNGNPPSNYVDLVKATLLEEGAELTIGDSVLYQKLLDNIYDVIPNATYCQIQTYSSTDASDTPSYAEENVAISGRQVAAFDESRIEVGLNSGVVS